MPHVLKAKRKDKLVSPTEHVMTDKHEQMNEPLKPLEEGREEEAAGTEALAPSEEKKRAKEG